MRRTNMSKKGCDVSSHNGTINWGAVKSDGIEFAILRVGYGMYDYQKINNLKITMQVLRLLEYLWGFIFIATLKAWQKLKEKLTVLLNG